MDVLERGIVELGDVHPASLDQVVDDQVEEFGLIGS